VVAGKAWGKASGEATTGCIGKHENIVAHIENAQQNGHKKCADHDVERKAASEIIMEQIRTNRQLTTLLEDLPLSPLGLRKKTKTEGMGTSFTLWFSFNAFLSYIKCPEQTFTSLLQDTELDPEAKIIVRPGDPEHEKGEDSCKQQKVRINATVNWGENNNLSL